MNNISQDIRLKCCCLFIVGHSSVKIMLEKTDHQVVDSSEECPYVELMVNSSSSCVCRPVFQREQKKKNRLFIVFLTLSLQFGPKATAGGILTQQYHIYFPVHS